MQIAQKAQEQLSFAISSPIDHSELLHHSQQDHVIAWLKGRRQANDREWHTLKPAQSQAWLVAQFDQPDVFISPNEFYGWRKISLLAGLNAVFLDFDLHNEKCTGEALAKKVQALVRSKLDEIQRRRWPAPTAVVFSGRGCHFYWVHDRVHSSALPRWQELTRTLARALDADKQATDCTRVLRVIGSRHSRTDTRVVGEQYGHARYDFDYLYEQFLPRKPQVQPQVRDIIAERAKQKKTVGRAIQMRLDGSPGEESQTKRGSIYAWWYLVYQDLRTISSSVFPAGVPIGRRISLIELYAHALSWFTLSDCLEDEIIEIAARVAPSLTKEEVLSQTSTIVQRARAHAEWRDTPVAERGKEPAGRYRFKRQTIYDRLSDLISDDMIGTLRAIVPEHVIEQRRKDRFSARYEDHNTGEGIRQGNVEKRAQARSMHAAGAAMNAISRDLGLSYNTIYRWLKT
jgi:hypothetical protein